MQDQQRAVCLQVGAPNVGCNLHQKVGISCNVKEGLRPLNGLRIQPEGDTTGWYIWAGEEFSEASDFFVPLHVVHLADWAPLVIPYLGLPPGWRFLLTEHYEDVWEDRELLKQVEKDLFRSVR
ncbi:immunity protein Imm33 domain-containing protein [Ralstonia pseudosolanacearum]|uniref:immunity protein Imm33 domain-containing protein n=1 Tax=Ralstonia pseudosolanacearum TaxID=1310165 RepID=UPI0026749AF3|nr:hypothetical protein [Ralstonia pseudosolanacearum]MDO3525187.1 hypothetical protein [Ralstonia pseudosolanacearum]MDO3549671.1 hypothetical protein [Ralstonia pseudosolanacearum]MDO3554840.1 hypothetical protein [Ralstonia pseudosolanacearum]MDO3564649.1 hypothetical protein [Ralstonia pseudosolanacearum]MDO3569537.1 hypothetical protein [Ralstonia pseudosolanacearum]